VCGVLIFISILIYCVYSLSSPHSPLRHRMLIARSRSLRSSIAKNWLRQRSLSVVLSLRKFPRCARLRGNKLRSPTLPALSHSLDAHCSCLSAVLNRFTRCILLLQYKCLLSPPRHRLGIGIAQAPANPRSASTLIHYIR
jgi:hypothetical protein